MFMWMLREHHITDDLISSKGSFVLPLCGIHIISESVLYSSSSEYTAIISTLTMPSQHYLCFRYVFRDKPGALKECLDLT